MKKLTVTEFKSVCDSAHIDSFLFDSENQPGFQEPHSSHLSLDFSDVQIALNPNVVYFKNTGCSLLLKRVQYIISQDEPSPLGTLYIIVCKDSQSKSNSKSYSVIARSSSCK